MFCELNQNETESHKKKKMTGMFSHLWNYFCLQSTVVMRLGGLSVERFLTDYFYDTEAALQSLLPEDSTLYLYR